MEKKQQDWRDKHHTLSSQLWYMYQNRINTDIELHVFNGQKSQTYHCHKVILMRLSPVFEKLMYVPEQGQGGVLSLTALRPDLFGLLVKYAYTDEIRIKSIVDALDLIKLCKLYDVSRLKTNAINYLQLNINTNTVWLILDFFDELNKKEKGLLSKKIDTVLTEQTTACLESDNFLSCSNTSLQHLLSKEVLSVESELPLVFAVQRWAQRCNSGVTLTPDKSKELLGACLSSVRFLSLTPTEFSEHVAKSGLLTDSDTLLTLLSISTNDANIPGWMCPLKSKRAQPAAAPKQQPLMPQAGPSSPVPKQPFKKQPQPGFNKNNPKNKNFRPQQQQQQQQQQPQQQVKDPFLPQLSIKSRKIETDRHDAKSNMSMVQFALDKETYLFNVHVLLTDAMMADKKIGVELSHLRVKFCEWKGAVLEATDFPQAILPAWVTLKKPLALKPTSDYLVVLYTPQSFSSVGIKRLEVEHISHTLRIFL
ncbi:kelch-like ECH-associated protein 1 isoform X2 [Cloeon dipterum]